MANKKISELTLGSPLETDVIPYVDLVAGETKKALKSELKGVQGDPGTAATATVGTTTTGAAGSDASVVNSGTTSAAIFDFTIPRGDTGATGPAGADGADGTDGVDITWLGAYSAGTTYAVNDAVSYNGSSYICKLASTGNVPTDTTYWDLMAQKGDAGAGTGDVLGPASSTADDIATFVNGTGKEIKDSGTKVADLVPKSLYDAQTILHATSDNTPVALTVGEQTVVGRATGGNISALSIDSDLSSVSANDDTIPSAKATKTALDAKLALAGGTMSGDIVLGENTALVYDPALSADGKYCGITEVVTAGETVAFGNVVYFKAADSKWWKTDADAEATSGPVKVAIVVVGGNADASITVMHRGKIREDDWNWTAGDELYLDTTTAGGLTGTAPSGADDVLRIVGYAQTADAIWFEPDNTYIVHV